MLTFPDFASASTSTPSADLGFLLATLLFSVALKWILELVKI